MADPSALVPAIFGLVLVVFFGIHLTLVALQWAADPDGRGLRELLLSAMLELGVMVLTVNALVRLFAWPPLVAQMTGHVVRGSLIVVAVALVASWVVEGRQRRRVDRPETANEREDRDFGDKRRDLEDLHTRERE